MKLFCIIHVLIISYLSNLSHGCECKSHISNSLNKGIRFLKCKLLPLSLGSLPYTLDYKQHFFIPKTDAFDNAVRLVKVPKTNGPQPSNLGFDKKGLLRACLKPNPNCFSTTPNILFSSFDEVDDDATDSSDGTSVEDIALIPKWRYKSGNIDEAFNKIGEVLDSYQPGHNEIDGGK